MAFTFQQPYEPHIEDRMRAFWQTLSEKDRRRFAALEAARLGHGGVEYIAEVLGCSTRTIERGATELDQLAQRSRWRTGTASGRWSKNQDCL